MRMGSVHLDEVKGSQEKKLENGQDKSEKKLNTRVAQREE